MATEPLIRNDDYTWTREFFDEDGQRLDLAGHRIWFTAKPSAGDDPTDATALVKHYIEFDGGGGVVLSRGFEVGGTVNAIPALGEVGDAEGKVLITSSEKGVLTQRLLEADKLALGAVSAAVWEISIEMPDGTDKTLERGDWTIAKDINERTTMP